MKWVLDNMLPDCNFELVIFKDMSRMDILSIFCEIALRWMPQDLTDNKRTLVQVMAWCRQAASHYLSQCWPWSMSPYGITKPHWLVAYTKWFLCVHAKEWKKNSHKAVILLHCGYFFSALVLLTQTWCYAAHRGTLVGETNLCHT